MVFGCTVYNLHFVESYNLLYLSEIKLKQLITVVLTTFTHLTLFNSSLIKQYGNNGEIH